MSRTRATETGRVLRRGLATQIVERHGFRARANAQPPITSTVNLGVAVLWPARRVRKDRRTRPRVGSDGNWLPAQQESGGESHYEALKHTDAYPIRGVN